MRYNTKRKQLKQNKKYNFRIFEDIKYNIISGYEYTYVLTDYNGNYIETFCTYQLLYDYLKKNKNFTL